MIGKGAIATEPQYICDVCGKKKPESQIAGKCVKCGKYLCSSCAKLKGDKVYCPEHAGCFIATAAYGSPMAREISVLRKFRDLKLETNICGKYLVRLYYAVSPLLANVIVCSEGLRALVRHCLSPIIQALKEKGY